MKKSELRQIIREEIMREAAEIKSWKQFLNASFSRLAKKTTDPEKAEKLFNSIRKDIIKYRFPAARSKAKNPLVSKLFAPDWAKSE